MGNKVYVYLQKIVMNIHTSFICNKENQQIKANSFTATDLIE